MHNITRTTFQIAHKVYQACCLIFIFQLDGIYVKGLSIGIAEQDPKPYLQYINLCTIDKVQDPIRLFQQIKSFKRLIKNIRNITRVDISNITRGLLVMLFDSLLSSYPRTLHCSQHFQVYFFFFFFFFGNDSSFSLPITL